MEEGKNWRGPNVAFCDTVQECLLRGSMSSSPVCAAEQHTAAHFMAEANKGYKHEKRGGIFSRTSCTWPCAHLIKAERQLPHAGLQVLITKAATKNTTPAAVASRDNVTLSHRATFSLSNADALAICSIMQLRWHATSTRLIAVHLVLLEPLCYGSREENTATHCNNSPCSLLKHSVTKCPHQCCFSMLHTADIFAIYPDSSLTLGAACVAPKVLQR